MEPLLKITTIPIEVEVTITRAQLKAKTEQPHADVTRQKGGLRIEAEPLRINIDTFQMRESMGQLSNETRIRKAAQDGIQLCYQAMARVVEEGNALADLPSGTTPADIQRQKLLSSARSADMVLEFLPKTGPDITWNGGKLSIQYEVDKLDFDWDVMTRPDFEFVPANIEFTVKQRPQVKIEYLGDPLYVPPSANPNYQEPLHMDTRA